MDYLSLLTEGYGGGTNEETAKELYNGVLGDELTVFTYNKNVANKTFKEITSVTGKDDYLTIENVIADPTTGDRISALLAMNVILKSCKIKHPIVDESGTTLSEVQNAMAIPTSDIVVSHNSITNVGHGAADSAMRSQMRFGFDVVTEILKNCCASHIVIHSILKSGLMTLYEKVKEWGPQQLEAPGQEMALCTILELMGKICEVVKEAKESTTRKTVKSNSSCGRCKAKGHGSSTIVTPFVNRVNARYDDCTSSAVRAIDSQNYNPPPEFLVKGGRKARNPRLLLTDEPGCSFTSSSNISSMIENWATGRVKERAKRARLDTGVRIIVDQLSKNEEEEEEKKEETPISKEVVPEVATQRFTKYLISPLPPSPGTARGGFTGETAPPESALPIVEASPMDGALAPTAEQVEEKASETLASESRGQTAGSVWVRLRHSANNKSIANYASKGSGINTGRYRLFNPTL